MQTTLKAPQLTPVWRRRLYRHRRWIAATLVGLAVLLIATSLQPTPPPAADASRPTPKSGNVAAPITLTDSTLASWLQPGDVVDVIAIGGDESDAPNSKVVATGATVLEIPGTSSGTFGASSTSGLIVLDVNASVAQELARARANSALTVVRTQ